MQGVRGAAGPSAGAPGAGPRQTPSPYEKQGTTIRKYYYAGGTRVAMREGTTLYWPLADHLGSTATTANADGSLKAQVRYKAFGEDRYGIGTTPTSFRYTGQRQESAIGLYYYNARWYDPALGRFVQADTVMPGAGNPQNLNRFSYAANNPVRYNDPTGHAAEEGWGGAGGPPRRPEWHQLDEGATPLGPTYYNGQVRSCSFTGGASDAYGYVSLDVVSGIRTEAGKEPMCEVQIFTSVEDNGAAREFLRRLPITGGTGETPQSSASCTLGMIQGEAFVSKGPDAWLGPMPFK